MRVLPLHTDQAATDTTSAAETNNTPFSQGREVAAFINMDAAFAGTVLIEVSNDGGSNWTTAATSGAVTAGTKANVLVQITLGTHVRSNVTRSAGTVSTGLMATP